MNDETFKPSEAFRDAASYASTSPQLRNVSNNVKLECYFTRSLPKYQSISLIYIGILQLYALYKMVTVSRAPLGSRPSIFDMTGRAKWDAWLKESKESEASKGSLEDVQNRYLALCGKFGWVPKAQREATGAQEPEPEEGREQGAEEEDVRDIDWDAPYDPSTDEHRHSGTAMGNAVSVLQEGIDHAVDSTTIHGLAVLGDAGKLKTLLDMDQEADVNHKDEYGYTALHLAADRGHTSIVKLLLERGADFSVLDADGFSAIELADASGKEEIVSVLRNGGSMKGD